MIGWVDASAGVSGDMLLGAVLDAGASLEAVRGAIARLGVPVDIEPSTTTRGSLRALQAHVRTAPAEDEPHRTLADVQDLLTALDEPVRDAASAVFTRLAEAEATVHGTTPDQVHFHEVGALDAIADVVGVVAGVLSLGLDRLHCSAIGVGSGRAGAAHGSLPVPVPAVVELARGLPLEAGPAAFESATPTGVALLAELVDAWGPLPAMSLSATGIGAGGRDAASHPNVVRLLLGEPTEPTQTDGTDAATWQLEANVDDMDPRLWPVVVDAVLAAGADDVWLTPMHMKKGRPAVTLSALTSAAARDAVERAVLLHSTSIGLRSWPVTKRALDRHLEHVEVDGQRIAVKVALLDGAEVNRSVEWDDVLAAAMALGRPAKDVLAEANARARQP